MRRSRVELRRLPVASAMTAVMVSSITNAGDAADKTQSSKLEEIVVTAQKRETILQQTPVAVNVVSGEELQKASVTQVKDLEMLVPNLSIANSGSSNQYSIRGVGAVNVGGIQPGVAMIVDGVYSQDSTAGTGAFFDVDQLEVLKGPQSTLFGRNATAGVINVRTTKPRFAWEEQVGVEAGSYGKFNANGILNIPFGDKVAMRLAVQSAKHDGYYKDGFDDEDTKSARLRTLFQITENLSFLITGDYARQLGKGNLVVSLNPVTGASVTPDPWAGLNNAQTQALYPAFHGQFGRYARQDNRNYGANGELEWTLGAAELASTTGYRVSKQESVAYYSSDAIAPLTEATEFSEELRLASINKAEALQWLVGLYYYDRENTGSNVTVTGLSPLAGNVPIYNGSATGLDFSKVQGSFQGGIDDKNGNRAVYTEESYQLTKWLRLAAGARRLSETQDGGGWSTTTYCLPASGPGLPCFPGTSVTPRTHTSWSATTWNTTLDATLSPSSLAYVGIATSWKAGGAPTNYLPPFDQAKPETLKAYTLGSKNRFFNERLQVNTELFYWDYRDRQVFTFATVTNRTSGLSNITAVTANAAKSHIQGLSADLMYMLTPATTLGVNFEYIDRALYDRLAQSENVLLSSGCMAKCKIGDLAPWSGNAFVRYRYDIGSFGSLNFDGTTRIASTHKMGTDGNLNNPAVLQEGYATINLGMAYLTSNARWNVRAYVDNLQDKLIKRQAQYVAGQFGSSASAVAAYDSPRTYGVQVRGSF